jgi:hypothetical protein
MSAAAMMVKQSNCVGRCLISYSYIDVGLLVREMTYVEKHGWW